MQALAVDYIAWLPSYDLDVNTQVLTLLALLVQ